MATPLNNSVLKAFQVLDLFSTNVPEITSALLVDRMGMNAATAHRFLTTLERAGALRQTRRGCYALGSRIEELGARAEETNVLSHVLGPEVDRVCRELGESVMACRFTRQGPVCISVAKASRAISVDIGIGTLLPALASAQGRIWLAEMPGDQRQARIRSLKIVEAAKAQEAGEALEEELRIIRKQGFALNLGINEPDIAAVSVPVRTRAGQAIGSLSVFGMLSRFGPGFVDRAKDRLTEAAERLSPSL